MLIMRETHITAIGGLLLKILFAWLSCFNTFWVTYWASRQQAHSNLLFCIFASGHGLKSTEVMRSAWQPWNEHSQGGINGSSHISIMTESFHGCWEKLSFILQNVQYFKSGPTGTVTYHPPPPPTIPNSAETVPGYKINSMVPQTHPMPRYGCWNAHFSIRCL